jgi:membrane-bound lytic murein transglycosylase B
LSYGPRRGSSCFKPQDEVELTTVRVPDFARIGPVQRTVNALPAGAAARAGLPDPSTVRPLAMEALHHAGAAPARYRVRAHPPRSPARHHPHYRVDRRAILGIAGVETRYGGFTGNARVLPALTRLAFDDERRQDYFRSELETLDLRALEGSYAGALGIPQFMPSNYRNLAVRYSGEGLPDLWDPRDAVASIANYVVRYDPTRAWQLGEPVVAAARVRGNVRDTLVNTVTSLERPRQNGVEIAGDTGKATTGRLLKMQRRDDSFEYWVGLPNFEGIRSYNPSKNYALAVAQLGDEILRGVRGRS